MNATPRSFRIALFLIASSSLVVPCEIARAEGPLTPRSQANAAVEPPKPPATTTPVPQPQPKAPPRVVRVHPQVSQSSLQREYRSLSMASPGSASTAALANETRFQETLDREFPQGTWQFAETPLCKVVAQVRESLKVPVELDTRALEDAGLDLETPVTKNISNVSLRSALRLLLSDADLTYIIKDEVLLITTKEKADEHLVVRFYPLPFGFVADNGAVDFVSLIELIKNAVASDTWDTVGGPGVIQKSCELRAMVVSQTREVHDEIEGFMRSLHARGLAELGVAADGSDPKAPVVRIHAVPDAEVRADLAAKLVDLCNASLEKGADAAARVTAVGDCLAVQSVSPEFHILAGQLIRGVAGVNVSPPPGHGIWPWLFYDGMGGMGAVSGSAFQPIGAGGSQPGHQRAARPAQGASALPGVQSRAEHGLQPAPLTGQSPRAAERAFGISRSTRASGSCSTTRGASSPSPTTSESWQRRSSSRPTIAAIRRTCSRSSRATLTRSRHPSTRS